MIKFITDIEQSSGLIFGMVIENQFFVDDRGQLCQKIDDDLYHIICDSEGMPFATEMSCYPSHKIQKILPHVTKIEF